VIEYIIITILSFAFLVLLIRHLSVKRQIRNINKQLQKNTPRCRSVSIELFDESIKALTLTINRAIEEYSQFLLDKDKEINILKNSIADISHDMRTPLTSIIGYLQLLNKTGLDGERAQYLNITLEKSHYLRKLLTDFHELAILDIKETVIEFTKCDLAGIVSDIILDNANEFFQKDITPIFENSSKPVYIMGEVKILQRVIQNLVSNCVKYSTGDVIFKIVESSTITLIIKNPSKNLKDLDHSRLFERFYRGDISRSGKGVGLGLPITYLLIKSIGGNISIDIDTDNFYVNLNFPRKTP